MKRGQQTTTITMTTDAEQGLLNFVKWAQENGMTQTEAMKVFRKTWKEYLVSCLELPEETETAKVYRKKVNAFLGANYKEFDEFAYSLGMIKKSPYIKINDSRYDSWERLECSHYGGTHLRWEKLFGEDTKRELIVEVCVSICEIDASKVDEYDFRKELASKLKTKFPVLTAPNAQGSLILAVLFYYIEQYKLKDWETKKTFLGLREKFMQMIEE